MLQSRRPKYSILFNASRCIFDQNIQYEANAREWVKVKGNREREALELVFSRVREEDRKGQRESEGEKDCYECDGKGNKF